MKKILSLVVALVLVCAACAAFAEATPSKTVEDTVAIVVADTNVEVAPVDAQANTVAVIDAFATAAAAGDVLSALPADVKAEIPDGFKTINEFVPVEVTLGAAEVAETKAVFTFATAYTAGEAVKVLVGVVNSADDVDWTILDGTVNADGAVEVVLPAELLKAIAGKEVVCAVLSK